MFPSILIQLENGQNEFYFYFYFVAKKIGKTKNKKTMALGVLFLLVHNIGCIILLWHFLGLPYNYFGTKNHLSDDERLKSSSEIGHKPNGACINAY